jgi:hypothetical protein
VIKLTYVKQGEASPEERKNNCAPSKKNCNSSQFAQYLNERVHTFGSLENIMQILIYQKQMPTFLQNASISTKKPHLLINLIINKRSFPLKPFALS